VYAEDAVPNAGPYSNVASATTPAPPDTEPPSAPGTLTASAFSDTQVDLSWGPATDNVGVTVYRIERCEGAGCSNFAEIAASTATTHMDVFLTPATTYTYRVRAEDAAGNQGSYSNEDSATTQDPPDTQPPSAPGTLTASAVSATQVDLSWGPATDNVGVTLYRIERCEGAGCSTFAEIATTTETTYASTGLTPSTPYSYRVRAEDAAGNQGPYSNEDSATTLALPDTEPPSAPGTLTASAVSATQVDLSWGPATDNVGVARYRIERCEGAGCSTFAEIATTTATAYPNTGLTPSTSYSYRVYAEDAVPNAGPYSNVASATTPALPPVEPLPTIDSFNRPNENPLSDAGRWSNGINGSAETGLRVASNRLACTRTTTCTAWRSNAQFGANVEVWSRVTTLPGNGNQIRLLARVQQPGTTTYDGYMLRTNQLSGTDQVFLERVDNGALVNRLTISQNLTAGDTLLLRVTGSTLQAWLKRGTTWSLLGSVVDATYGGPGYVGVGIRGKTGRLDDFGAR
jgi:chitodextrinase